MHVLRALPGCDMELIEIDGSVASMQAELGGGYSLTHLSRTVGVVYNPAAEGLGYPYNRRYNGNTLFGTFLVIGLAGEDIAELIKDPKVREWVLA